MPKIYISGPMTGLPELNFPAFNAESARLRAMGFDVVNPAELNPDGASWGDCMRKDIAALMGCDTVATLPGWENSKGAQLEVLIGQRLEMAVVKAQDLVHPPENASAHIDRPDIEVERLRKALKFYADREHYHFESGNWDTVSGEPLNILWNGDEPDFVEDGSVARSALAEGKEHDDPYPPCDYCGTVPDHHPWHGSGLLNGVLNKHIHACDACRSKLPSHGAPVQIGHELPDGLSWNQAPANAIALIGGKIDEMQPERKLFVWVSELGQQTMGVLAAPFDHRPTGSPQSAALSSPNSQWVVLARRPADHINAPAPATQQ
ncbi:hypothetical protein PSCICE_02840 [Pseudomonas cichorii]|nr:DUF4406 domain-containing protein [Pseudomonas cichorii]GFM49017.1 hypothetical protein PSCICE_02840 [Pseudomonas cichorii]